MNARSLLNETLRQRVAELSLGEIQELLSLLKCDVTELEIFFRVVAAQKKKKSKNEN